MHSDFPQPVKDAIKELRPRGKTKFNFHPKVKVEFLNNKTALIIYNRKKYIVCR